eukprot:9351602-Pyramimonas_sp.AAC.1
MQSVSFFNDNGDEVFKRRALNADRDNECTKEEYCTSVLDRGIRKGACCGATMAAPDTLDQSK